MPGMISQVDMEMRTGRTHGIFCKCKCNVNAQMPLIIMDHEGSFPTPAVNLMCSRELPGGGFLQQPQGIWNAALELRVEFEHLPSGSLNVDAKSTWAHSTLVESPRSCPCTLRVRTGSVCPRMLLGFFSSLWLPGDSELTFSRAPMVSCWALIVSILFLCRLFPFNAVLETFSKYQLLQPWMVWLSGLSTALTTKGLLVRFPVRAHAWIVGQVPQQGAWERQLHSDVFLPLFLPLYPYLCKNK